MLLEKINSIPDLKKLSKGELPLLCQEIRQLLIETVSQNGGHLASNLGVVELTVALLYTYDLQDKIVFDVGHQSYVYKILTGRRENFHTLRKQGGISGFPCVEESEFDLFTCGHASTAISSCLGLCKARDISGQNFDVVSVVGDGAFTGGMTFEGLNNIGDTSRFLIIVNDNDMSINKSIGNAVGGFSSIRMGRYAKRKQAIKKFTRKIPLIGKPIYSFVSFCKRVVKYGFINNNLYFNSFGLKYVALKQGNDVFKLVEYLTKLKNNCYETTVFHVKTVKGKGLPQAEKDATAYHCISAVKSFDNMPVNPSVENTQEQSVDKNEINANGCVNQANQCQGENEKKDVLRQQTEEFSFTKTLGDSLCCLASEHDNVVAITAAMTDGVGLTDFAKQYTTRFFDVGIAEQHAVTFAAGLAKGGIKPFVCIYSTFLQRAHDQIIQDVCMQNLPVVFCIDHAGFVGSDGKTHQGLFDISFLNAIPNLTIWSPSSLSQLQEMIKKSYSFKFPLAIRYPKGTLHNLSCSQTIDNWSVFSSLERASVTGDVRSVILLAVGANSLYEANEAAKMLYANGYNTKVVNCTTLKPLDCQFLKNLQSDLIVTVEEGYLSGGFGSSVTNYYACNSSLPVLNICVPDNFIDHAEIPVQMTNSHLDAHSIYQKVLNYFSK